MISTPIRPAQHPPSPTLFCAAMLLMLGLSACTEDNPAFVEPERCQGGQELYLQTFPATHPQRLDVVLLVANGQGSEAMLAALRDAASDLIRAVTDYDYRIGVVLAGGSSTLYNPMGDACPSKAYVSANDPNPSAALDCLLAITPARATLPTALESLVAALGQQANPGFIRPEATTLVIAISLHDDCSNQGRLTHTDLAHCEWQRALLTPMTELYPQLRATTANLNALHFLAIVGPTDDFTFAPGTPPSSACQGALGDAWHAPRYHRLAALMGNQAQVQSICTASLAATLRNAIASTLQNGDEAHYCLGRPAMGGVRRVELLNRTAPTKTPQVIPANQHGGFAFIGATQSCPNGLVIVDPEARQTVTADDGFDVYFCGN